jgi:hypothetical protein
MADYYSLLARKIASLPNSTPESRQAIYQLARKALFNQLRAITPPVAEEVIAAEGRALDDAIARLEAEGLAAARANEPPPPPAAPSPPAAEPQTAPSPEPSEKDPAPRPEAKENAKRAGTTTGERTRPAAPLGRPRQGLHPGRRFLAIASVLVLLVGLVALAAWRFRERPEDLAKFGAPETTTDTNDRGKLGARVGADDSAGASGAKGSQAPLPVAQKAEFYVAYATQPDKVERIYNGVVVWRLENLGGGDGAPVQPAIRGDVDFPEAKVKATILIQKNLDATLSASHTVNLGFKFSTDGDLKGIKAIGAIEVRRPDAQVGEKIAGIPVPINDTNFLIGLMRGQPEQRNLALLRAPAIIDLPLQLSDGRMATINLEKGSSGDRVFADALDAWAR